MLANTRHRARQQNVVRVGVPTQESVIGAIRALCIKRYGDASPEHMHQLFLDFDKNGDGCLSGNELNTLLNVVDQCVAILGCSPVSKAIIDKLDTDGNRCITWEEYAKVAGIPLDTKSGLTESGPIVKPALIAEKGKFDELNKGVKTAPKFSGKTAPKASSPTPTKAKDGGGGMLFVLGGAVVGLALLAR